MVSGALITVLGFVTSIINFLGFSGQRWDGWLMLLAVPIGIGFVWIGYLFFMARPVVRKVILIILIANNGLAMLFGATWQELLFPLLLSGGIALFLYRHEKMRAYFDVAAAGTTEPAK